MTTDNFCFYLQNRLIQTSLTGGQWYSDTSPFSIPWLYLNISRGWRVKHSSLFWQSNSDKEEEKVYTNGHLMDSQKTCMLMKDNLTEMMGNN